MVLYLCRISQLDDMQGVNLLTPERQLAFAQYRQRNDKLRCLAAGLLIRFLLKEKAELVEEGEKGKPFLPDGSVHFNISHSGDWVALAADENEIGVDVERLAPVREGVARRCYTHGELCWLKEQNDESAFFTLWTGKESIMKATGKGFSMPPESFSLMPIEEGLHRICGESWFLHWYSLDGYALCTASKCSEKAQPVFLSRQELLMP